MKVFQRVQEQSGPCPIRSLNLIIVFSATFRFFSNNVSCVYVSLLCQSDGIIFLGLVFLGLPTGI